MTPETVAHQAPLSMNFPGKNTIVGCLFLFQGVCLLVALCVSVWLLVCVLSGSRVQLVGWLSVWLCGGAGAALAQNCWWPHVAAPRP